MSDTRYVRKISFFILKPFFSFLNFFVQGVRYHDTIWKFIECAQLDGLYCYPVRSHKGSTGLGSTRSSKTELLSAMTTLFHPHLLFLLLYSALHFSYHCVMLVASPCLAVPIGFGTFYISLTRGVSLTQWPCHLHWKASLGKRRILWKLQYFTMQKYNLQKLL